jgi:hypothetical protein
MTHFWSLTLLATVFLWPCLAVAAPARTTPAPSLLTPTENYCKLYADYLLWIAHERDRGVTYLRMVAYIRARKFSTHTQQSLEHDMRLIYDTGIEAIRVHQVGELACLKALTPTETETPATKSLPARQW